MHAVANQPIPSFPTPQGDAPQRCIFDGIIPRSRPAAYILSFDLLDDHLALHFPLNSQISEPSTHSESFLPTSLTAPINNNLNHHFSTRLLCTRVGGKATSVRCQDFAPLGLNGRIYLLHHRDPCLLPVQEILGDRPLVACSWPRSFSHPFLIQAIANLFELLFATPKQT